MRPMGRLPEHDPAVAPRLHLTPHIDVDQVVIPDVVDWSTKVPSWPMYLNDKLGCCTCSAAAHLIQSWTAQACGHAATITDSAVLSAYEQVSGYNPGHPNTDAGANMQDVLNYWRKTGIGGHRIAAFARLHEQDRDRVKAALYLFGGVQVGVQLTAGSIRQFDANKPWSAVGDDTHVEGGHAVHLVGADSHGVKFTSWGRIQHATWEWWQHHVEEAWVPISYEWLTSKGPAANGLNATALNHEYQALTGMPGPFKATA